MARAGASVRDLEDGTLPRVCAKTGEWADGYVRIEFAQTPGWTAILLLFGLLPFLIASAFATVRIVGIVPMSDQALRRGRSFTWVYRGLFLLAMLVVGIGIWADADVVVRGGVVAFLAALVVMVVGRPFFWPRGRLDGDWVSLSFVHPRFADALEDR